MLKLTVYVPESHLERVKNALFDAGAGRYRAYDRCCWQVPGTGQFRPLPGSHPFLGSQDRLETVPEWRVEMLCPDDRAAAAVAALRGAHPYEEPAFDLVRIEGSLSR
jgi:hypothetical protein